MELINQIFNHLFEHNVKVYYPFAHKMDIKSNYVVVKDLKQNSYQNSIIKPRVELLLYSENYQNLLSYKENIKNIMEQARKIKGFHSEYDDSQIIYDDSCKAYMISFSYYSYKTIKKE